MDERIEELFPFYALGALTDEERAQVDAYVATNPEAQARLAEMIHVLSVLPYGVTPVEPPARVKAVLMNRVNADARARFAPAPQRSVFSLPGLLGALRPRASLALAAFAGLSLVVAILASAWALSLNNEVARLRDEMADLRRDLATQRAALEQIALPGVQLMAITGTLQPDAHGQLVADPASESAVLIVSGLMQLEPGKVYQFWLIRGGVPVDAGVFSVDEQGRAILAVRADAAVGSFDAMGVSIEPGRQAQPTGDIVMFSSLS